MPEPGDYPMSAVADALTSGLSASAGLRSYREAGGEVRTQTWYRAFGEAQAALSGREAEITRPLDRAPSADEMTSWSTVNASGYLHQVEVFVRDRVSGDVIAKPWSVTTDTPMTRGDAIGRALDSYESGAGDYEEVVLFAVHVGAFSLEPGA